MAVRILLVEPHDHVKHAFKKAISGTKYEVVGEAANGDEAMELFRSIQPPVEMVVMDMNFPGKGGIGTMEEMHKHRKLPVVLIYDKKSAFRVMEGTKRGAASQVRFPFASPEKVLQQLAIAEGGGASATLGSDDHFVRLEKPLAVTIKKIGLFSFISGRKPGVAEKLSVNVAILLTEGSYREGDSLQISIEFRGGPEVVKGKITSIKPRGTGHELQVRLTMDKEQRDLLRQRLLRLAVQG